MDNPIRKKLNGFPDWLALSPNIELEPDDETFVEALTIWLRQPGVAGDTEIAGAETITELKAVGAELALAYEGGPGDGCAIFADPD